MRLLVRRLPYALPVWLLVPVLPVLAQEAEGPRAVDVPNSMGIHTWFIIAVVAAFLAWCISYSLQLQCETVERQKARGGLSKQKEELFDKIAALEDRKEAGQITDQRYKHEMRELRFQLAKLLEKSTQSEAPKSAKRT